MSIKKLLTETNNITRSSYVWNTINACVSAMVSPVLTIVLTRVNGLEDAGIYSIAFAVANLLLYLGQYGFRRFQSSDVTERYSFPEYYGIRIITCASMMIAALAYCVYGSAVKGYSAEKFAVIMLICGVKLIQAFSDVIHGRMQQLGRLDVATKASCFRYVCEIVSFCLTVVLTHNLVLASLVCVIVSIVVFIITSYNVGKDYCDYRPSFEPGAMKRLMIEGFPLFLSLFLNMYISNAPKYAIDAYLNEEVQALYGLVFMPAYVISLVAHFIFNPILKSYAEVWNEGRIKRFRFLVLRQCGVITGLTVLALIVAATIAVPILSWLYGVDISGYKTELYVVVIGGGMLAFSVFFNTVITIIRMHKTLLYTYGATALAALLLSKYFVVNYGIMGAVAMYAVLMTMLSAVLAVITFLRIKKEMPGATDAGVKSEERAV